jgi:hypothetical protein
MSDHDPHKGYASSFADPEDVLRFNRCKKRGFSDGKCFKVGDNGIGKWGHNTAQNHTPMAAIPRDVWAAAGKKGGAQIKVTWKGKTVPGILGDTLPATENITNGAVIDLNPAFAIAFGVKPPFMLHDVEWEWV